MKRAAAGQQYAIVVGLVSVIAIAAIATTGGTIGSLFTGVSNQLGGATNGTIGARPSNQKPDFVMGGDQTIVAGSGLQTVSGFIASFDPGAGDSGQTVLTYLVSVSDPNGVLSGPVAIDPSGTLTYTPHATNNGTAIVTVRVQDSGGTSNGGVDTSDPKVFNIIVSPIPNQKPSVSIGGNQTIAAGSGLQTVNGFATGFNPGAPHESSQTILAYQVSKTDPNSVISSIAISTAGVLTYTPHASNTGSATVSVRVQDSGGTANGGVDLSDPVSFTITVTGATQYATGILTGAKVGTKSFVFLYVPVGTSFTSNADYKNYCESKGFAQNQNNQNQTPYTSAGMYNTTNYYCNTHCCYMGSGNSARNYITNFQNYGLPLNTGMPVLDRGCGDYGGNGFTYGLNTSDRLTVTSSTAYTYAADSYGARDYQVASKRNAINPTTTGAVMLCQMP